MRLPCNRLVFGKQPHELTWSDLELHRSLLLGLVPLAQAERYFTP
jgi:hypothetical protein